ncbi:Scr1 family TA system antitoxin-like transcriptional regulator [Nocardiopsis dassonvillei]|uniref:helix-turn-helix domain-containing protein n=1 Tax=Nocardiopsis dassonvillei TaxID=2014 RepID=UPI003F56EB7C
MTPNYFAQALTEHRELAGLTRAQVAALAHVSPSTITRWEQGEATPQRDNAESLDKALGAGGKLREAWRSVKGRGGLPEWARDLDAIERAARHVSLISPSLVPGMLQSESYARAVFRAGQPLASPEDLARLVSVRCERLAALEELDVTAVFPASAVSGLPEPIRKDQAAHLVKWMDSGRVAVHLVPEGSALLVPASPLMLYALRSGERVIASDHAGGTVICAADMHDAMAALGTAALAASLPVTLSREALEPLT